MSGTISLPYYPDTNRTPGFFADVDGSQANTALFQQRALMIGLMLSSGLAVPGVAILVTSLAQVGLLTGVGSMIYEMVRQYRGQDTFGELWILPIPDPAGTKAEGFLSISGSAIANGLLSDYFGGILVPCPVTAGMTSAQIAAQLAGLIGANPDLAVTASVQGATLALTAKHAGLDGNDIDLRANFLGAVAGETDVPGVVQAFTPMAGGEGAPDNLAGALASLGDVTYDFIACPFTDPASLDALDAFLDQSAGRWSWQQMLFGGYFTAVRGSVGTMAASGMSRNGKNGSGLMVLPDEPDPLWIHAADYTAKCAGSLRVDPGLPLQYIVLGTKAPPVGSRITRSLRNTLLYDGISTKFVNDAGQNVLERAVTFYQTNAAGSPDDSFLNVETLYGLALLLRGWQARMASLFGRKKLVQDGTPIPAGSNLTTPKLITLSTIAWYQQECDAGNAQDPAGFAKAIFSQNAGNGLVKELLPFILVSQLRQIAALAAFTKP